MWIYTYIYIYIYNLEEGPPLELSNDTCPNQQAKHNQNRRILLHVGPIFLDFGALKTSRSDQIWPLQRRFVPSLLIMHRLELAWDALGAQELIPRSRDVCHCLHFGASWAPKPGQVSLPKPFCIEIRRCAQYPIISYTEATSAGFELSIKSCRNQC